MNVDPPESLFAIRSPSPLGALLGRAFMLDRTLPADIGRCVSRLRGSPGQNEDALNREPGNE